MLRGGVNVYVLDTSVVLEIVNKGERWETIIDLVEGEDIGITSFTVYELLRGAKSHEFSRLLAFVRSISCLSFDADDAELTSELEQVQKSLGRPLGKVDLFIGSMCVQRGATIVTCDKRFSSLKYLSVLLVK
jgi:predicted nucleic acid-binding protein